MSDREAKLSFLLPAFVSELGSACSREYCEDKTDMECGCPNCLENKGLTLAFDVRDWNSSDDLPEHWRKRILSLRTARLAKHLICPGYPGHDAAAAERRRPSTESSGDTPPPESLPTVD